jgi:hypothetical protein
MPIGEFLLINKIIIYNIALCKTYLSVIATDSLILKRNLQIEQKPVVLPAFFVENAKSGY